MMTFRSIAALLLGGLLAAGGAQATTFSPLTLVQQAKKADVIVQATIGIPTSVTENNQVYAVYPLKVSETLAGDSATLPQTVGSQGGGGPAVFVLSGVESAPVFQAGQEVVLLLYTGRLDSPLVGYNQGAYLISNGQVSVLNSPLASAPGAGTVAQPSVLQIPAVQNPAAQIPVAQASATQASASAAQTAVTATPAPPDPVLPVAAGTPVPPPATPGTPVAPAPVPPSAGPVPEPPIPVFTTAESPEAQPLSPVPPAAGSSAAVIAPPTAPVAVTPGISAPGVLGTIRTAAELKAAIVAARAGK
jgi:hypothetical protein